MRKTGRRNNKEDRQRLSNIKAAAMAIHQHASDMEPNMEPGADQTGNGESGGESMKAANLYDWIISRIHMDFTCMADELYGNGYLTQDERKALSGAIGAALDAFNAASESLAQLKERRPYEEAPEADDDTPEVADNALKAISSTDTELRVANYMVLFNGRDLEGLASKRKNADGSKGEFFTKATAFDSDYTQTGVLYVDWEHATGSEGAGADDILGYVDWKSAKIDDKGVFVERVLNRRNRYVQFVEDLIKDGLVGNSTEAVSAGVQKGSNGEIKAWPLRRDTLTVSPMEPRMITQNALNAIKGLSEKYPGIYKAIGLEPTGKGAEEARSIKLKLLELISIESGVTQ